MFSRWGAGCHFSHASELKELDLRSNDLSQLHAEAFSGWANYRNSTWNKAPHKLSCLLKSFRGSASCRSWTWVTTGWESFRLMSLQGLALRNLDLSENYVGELKIEVVANLFTGLSNLEELDLSENSLSELSADAADVFSWLGKLQKLDLGYNSLDLDEFSAEVWANLFTRLSNLQELTLRANSLKELLPEFFSGLSKLQYLDLSQNGLSVLHAEVFQGLSQLQTLDLSINYLRELRLLKYLQGSASCASWTWGTTHSEICLVKFGANCFPGSSTWSTSLCGWTVSESCLESCLQFVGVYVAGAARPRIWGTRWPVSVKNGALWPSDWVETCRNLPFWWTSKSLDHYFNPF